MSISIRARKAHRPPSFITSPRHTADRGRARPPVSPRVRRSIMEFSSAWALFQLVDPLLPTGGFAHSVGLEPATLAGVTLHDDADGVDDVERFAARAGQHAIDSAVPFVLASRECVATAMTTASTSSTPTAGCATPAPPWLDAWVALNREFTALSAGNHVASRASASTGSALLRAAHTSFAADDTIGALRAIRDARRFSADAAPPHAAPVFGAIAAVLRLDRLTTVRTFVYLVLRDACSAATRLNASGPLETSAALRRLARFAEPACASALRRHDLHAKPRTVDKDGTDAHATTTTTTTTMRRGEVRHHTTTTTTTTTRRLIEYPSSCEMCSGFG